MTARRRDPTRQAIALVQAMVLLVWCVVAPVLNAQTPGPPAGQVSPSIPPGAVARPAAPTVNTGATLANIQGEIEILKGQVGKLTGQAAAAEAAAKPLVQAGQGMVGTAKTFPARVAAFRQQYGIPLKNPTIDQEWQGIQRWMLEKGGMKPLQAKAMAVKMGNTAVVEHLKQPFRPQSILMAVGAVAGMNIISQVRSGEGVDVGKAVSFVKEKSFWGGMAASGVAYALASYVAMAVMPPGAGILRALLPTFAGMAGSFVGWEIGTNPEGKSVGEVLKGLDIAELLGQAAGSSLGLIMGGQLALVLFGTMSSLAGPLGAIAGAVILGGLGKKLAGFIRDFFTGDKEALKKAKTEMKGFLAKSKKVVKRLEEAGVLSQAVAQTGIPTDVMASELQARYSTLYGEFIRAQEEGRSADAVSYLLELREAKAAFNRHVHETVVGQPSQK